MTEETLFHEALAKATPQDRAAFLEAACVGQPELRASLASSTVARLNRAGRSSSWSWFAAYRSLTSAMTTT